MEAWRQRFRPQAVLRTALETLGEQGGMLVTLPGRLQEFLDRVERGNLVWRLDPAETQRVLGRLEAMVNRLVLGAVLLSLAILAAALIAARSPLGLTLGGLRIHHMELWLLGVIGVIMAWLTALVLRRH